MERRRLSETVDSRKSEDIVGQKAPAEKQAPIDPASPNRSVCLITTERGDAMEQNKIMLVDDNRDLVTVVKISLENKGYSVRSANSGKELFSRLEEEKPDLIVLDVMMPEMDGLEVLKRLKAAQETSAIPVILLTAKVHYEDILNAYKLGAAFYITKPFTSVQLLEGIKRVLFSQNSHTTHT